MARGYYRLAADASSSDDMRWVASAPNGQAFEERGALAGLWISDKNSTGLPPDKYHRCWPFHLAMKPFYHLMRHGLVGGKAFLCPFPIWRWWLKWQSWPNCDVVQAIMGFATEPFDWADRMGALKVVDAPNSHPDQLLRLYAAGM